MAKRTRGSNRVVQRHADRHAPAKPQPRPATRPASALSDEEEARAAELESKIVAQERASDVGRSRTRSRSADTRLGAPRGQGLLAARAAEEYGYVVRDVRRIVQVGGALAIVLLALFVAIDILHVVSLG
jgi:hypothetical protein